MRYLFAAACLALALGSAHAGETEARKAIAEEIGAAFQRSDFLAIESRYSRALDRQERLPSGLFAANYIFRSASQAAPPPPAGVTAARGRDDHWNAIEEKAGRWAAQFPDSVLPALALSQAYFVHGWSYRGTGFASTVGKEDLEKFLRLMDKANEALESRRELGERDPNWWYMMLQVARLQGWPKPRYMALAAQALDAFPDHYEIYFAIADSLVPQWGGSPQVLAAFAEHAVARTSTTEGASLYARIYVSAHFYLGAAYFATPEAKWTRLREGFEDLIKRYPDAWNLNHYARVACEAGDKPTTRQLVARIKESVDPQVWPSRAVFNRCSNWAVS